MSLFKITEKEFQADIKAGVKVFNDALLKLEKAKEKLHLYKEQRKQDSEKLSAELAAKQAEILGKISENESAELRADEDLKGLNSIISKIKDIVG